MADEPVSALMPRLVEPELRARVAGYLDNAPAIDDEHRSDGTWTWPRTMAAGVLAAGVGPSQAMLDHLVSRLYQPPSTLSAGADPRRVTEPPPPPDSFVVDRRGRVWRDEQGLVPIVPVGLYATVGAPAPHPDPASLLAVSPIGAAMVLDEVTARRHAELVADAAESEAGVAPGHGGGSREGVRLARVYDAELGAAFSPHRLRLLDPERRDRVADYLTAGRLVLRATGRIADPLSASSEPVLGLGWRTDGSWVWQEALAYYVRVRGVAPELELLCHIEARAARPVSEVDPLALRLAAETVALGPPPFPPRRRFWYFVRGEQLLRTPGGQGLPGESPLELLDQDLRWRVAPGQEYPAAVEGLDRIDEATVARILDSRCVTGVATAG